MRVVIVAALLAVLVGLYACVLGTDRIAVARTVCQQAKAEHRLIGRFDRCVYWNAIHNEDNDN